MTLKRTAFGTEKHPDANCLTSKVPGGDLRIIPATPVTTTQGHKLPVLWRPRTRNPGKYSEIAEKLDTDFCHVVGRRLSSYSGSTPLLLLPFKPPANPPIGHFFVLQNSVTSPPPSTPTPPHPDHIAPAPCWRYWSSLICSHAVDLLLSAGQVIHLMRTICVERLASV